MIGVKDRRRYVIEIMPISTLRGIIGRIFVLKGMRLALS